MAKKFEMNGLEFKVGDKVRIVREIKSHHPDGMGNGVEWKNSWTHEMTDFIGHIGFITEMSTEGVFISGAGRWNWPLTALTNLSVIKNKYPELKVYQRVVTRSEGTWIVLPIFEIAKENYPGNDLILVNFYDDGKIAGFNLIDFELSGSCYDIMEVHNPPVYFSSNLKPECKGSLIWSRNDDSKKKNAIKQRKEAAQRNIDKLKARIAELEQLKKEIENA